MLFPYKKNWILFITRRRKRPGGEGGLDSASYKATDDIFALMKCCWGRKEKKGKEKKGKRKKYAS